MRNLRAFAIALVSALIFSMGLLAQAAPKDPDAPLRDEASRTQIRKGNAGTLHGYVVLLRLRYDLFAKWKATGKWPDDPEANKALEGHSAYWQKQLEAGHALLAGGMSGDYWDNAALIIFEAASQPEAEAIVAADPAVKAYVFQAQVRPFDVSFISTKYDGR